ncbi:MAG: hypothetical protein ABI789_04575, partial [Usitatibacter sp.]
NYTSELTVENLPSVSLGSVSFSPKVGGKITDLNPKRKFPLVGVLKDEELNLEVATPEPQRPPIEFTIRAEWSARQMGGGQRESKITPEMRQALDKLREQK